MFRGGLAGVRLRRGALEPHQPHQSLYSLAVDDSPFRFELCPYPHTAKWSGTGSTEDAAIAQHIATVEAENRRLRRSLEEAESKLEAITSIERSVRDQ